MHYSKSLLIYSTPEKVFKALVSQIELWWGKVDIEYKKVGDLFSVYFGDTEWRFEIIELEQDKRVVWKCVKAHHVDNLDGIKEEWLGTEVVWKLSDQDGSTQLEFEHIGLDQHLNCYGICEAGWNYFIGESLKAFLEKGEGKPYNN